MSQLQSSNPSDFWWRKTCKQDGNNFYQWNWPNTLHHIWQTCFYFQSRFCVLPVTTASFFKLRMREIFQSQLTCLVFLWKLVTSGIRTCYHYKVLTLPIFDDVKLVNKTETTFIHEIGQLPYNILDKRVFIFCKGFAFCKLLQPVSLD